MMKYLMDDQKMVEEIDEANTDIQLTPALLAENQGELGILKFLTDEVISKS